MNRQQLIDVLHEHCRNGWGDTSQYMCGGITKKEVASVLHYLGKVVRDEVLLKADKVNLPGLGQAHASWLPKSGPKKQLYAQFDWDPKVEAALTAAAKP